MIKSAIMINEIITKKGVITGINNSHQLNFINPMICKATNSTVNIIPIMKCLTLTGIRSNIFVTYGVNNSSIK